MKLALPAFNLHEESNQFSLRQQQLTLPYLLSGYYPKHSLLVAITGLALSAAALTCLPHQPASTSEIKPPSSHFHHHHHHTHHHHNHSMKKTAETSDSVLLFHSLTTFLGLLAALTLSLTGFYRLLLNDSKHASTRSCPSTQQADFLVDVVFKGTVNAIARTLLEGSTTARAGLIVGVSLVAELGKLFHSTPAVLVTLFLAWIAFLVYRHYLPDYVKARLLACFPR